MNSKLCQCQTPEASNFAIQFDKVMEKREAAEKHYNFVSAMVWSSPTSCAAEQMQEDLRRLFERLKLIPLMLKPPTDKDAYSFLKTQFERNRRQHQIRFAFALGASLSLIELIKLKQAVADKFIIFAPQFIEAAIKAYLRKKNKSAESCHQLFRNHGVYCYRNPFDPDLTEKIRRFRNFT